MPKPIVALVGRPNVGKSTFFNRLIGEHRAIIEDIPGTTRDRLYGESFWNGREFTVVDTAGLIFEDEQADIPAAELHGRTRAQARLALEEADAVIFMVDGRDGLTTADADVAEILRPMAKHVVLAVNKADSVERQLDAVEFYALNLGDPIPMSAFHGLGTGDVLDRLVAIFPANEEDPDAETPLRIAIVGRPNVGKSSLVNRLIGSERAVVSSVPGTTRDALDTTITVHGEPVTLIDTAGIRRSGRIERGIEKYSVLRALRAIERADVVLLLVDATEGVTSQDTHIAGMILEAKKGVAILVNKWDAVAKDNSTYNAFEAEVREAFKFMSYAPILFISALDGQRTGRIIQLAHEIQDQRRKRVPTAELNGFLRQAVLDQPPMAVKKGAHLRLYYAVQPQVEPPVFLFFANDGSLVHWSYARYLENRLRERYDFGGTPIVIVFRSREKKDER